MNGLTDSLSLALGNLADSARNLSEPSLRLGVTGLARSGKTVFITALVNAFLSESRLPAFAAHAEGRIRRAWLQPQPDDTVPRFAFEDHLAALTGKDRHWPRSTRRISQLRLTIEYDPQGWLGRRLSRGRLNIDITDYPGEWLLDLPLLDMNYTGWSARTLAQADEAVRRPLAQKWRRFTASLAPLEEADEGAARRAAELFTAYLQACRDEKVSLSTVPPGRFLMPGDLEGSPALTFAPLDLPEDGTSPPRGSLWRMMDRRFEAYKTHVVKPFFRTHFARLDRQIVLVDALSALNAGPAAIADLEQALSDILQAFRPGRNSWLSSLLARRIDRIAFAATKADHLHHTSHDRLQAILGLLTNRAGKRATTAGAAIAPLAMAAIRATREARVRQDGQVLDCIVGIPLAGEKLGEDIFDGEEELAIFPGDLPEDPMSVLDPDAWAKAAPELRFVRFRPPAVKPARPGDTPALPHIRLDRAIDFLIGDRLA